LVSARGEAKTTLSALDVEKMAGATAAGASAGLIDGAVLVPVVGGGSALAALATGREYVINDERRSPLDEDTHFEVRGSPGMGRGLFALEPIAAETFLFDYRGEVLTEEQMFARYPEANGRYIACITDEMYIDGAFPELSNVARWMNHAPAAQANVEWRKQRLGPRKAMHFYACRPIERGDELCFDYGSEYWEALGEQPLQ